MTFPKVARRVSNLKYVLQAYGDGSLFGEPYGAGPVRVIWLHGWARRGHDFAQSAALLATKGVASVALDLPGFGASPPPAHAGGARDYAERLAPALAGLGAGPFVLVGHSFGGTVATAMAAQNPELVHALVLIGVPLVRSGRSRSPWQFRAARVLHQRHLIRDTRMEVARQKYGSVDYRNAVGVMRDVLVIRVNESYEHELANIVAPVTLLWGENDTVVPVEIAQRSSTLLTSANTLRLLSGVGHLVPTEAPDDVAATVFGVLS